MLETALAYLKLGWSVIPVHRPINGLCTCGREDCPNMGKHPRIKWDEYIRRLPTEEEITSWFGDLYAGSNIGLVTGSVSKICVVDLDRSDGLDVVKGQLKLPTNTLTSQTGGGGMHLYYRLNGDTIPSRIGMIDHVDIKSEKGFVVLPPSKHKSGRSYQWLKDLPMVETDLSVLKPPPSIGNESHGSTWFDAFLDGVGEGMRSNAASKLAGRYCRLGLNLREIKYLMFWWNEHQNKPPMAYAELSQTIDSTYRWWSANGKPAQVTSLKEVADIFENIQKGRIHG